LNEMQNTCVHPVPVNECCSLHSVSPF